MSDPNSDRVECILCGATESSMTREHVYGDWLRDVLPEPERLRMRTRHDHDPTTGKTTTTEWTEREYRHQTRRRVFCDRCNNVWGSQLESATKLVLPDLIRGRYCTVLERGTRVIATWAMKIAIVREYFDPPSQRVVTREQRHEFRRTNEPPSDTLILAAPIWKEAGRWPARDRHRSFIGWLGSAIDDGIALDANMHITSFGFGRIALVVAGTSFGGSVFDPSEVVPEAFVRVWPNPQPFLWPPPEASTDAELDLLSGDEPRFLFPTVNVIG